MAGNKEMKRFYFTYGCSDSQAFEYGWSIVYAEDMRQAVNLYTLVHPLVDGLIPCAFYYTSDDFEKTEAFMEGNGGMYCHEVIRLQVEEYHRDDCRSNRRKRDTP